MTTGEPFPKPHPGKDDPIPDYDEKLGDDDDREEKEKRKGD